MSHDGPQHRADIDGLRAVAVLAVILYHLDLKVPAAGFAGVDVFFVISGYLIGGIVLRSVADGTFSLRSFYARRARRILPALCVVMLCCLPVAWAVMTPHQLRYFGGGVLATLLFVSNVWFFARIDYFNPDAELDPLLHTWSLGVEEQFYLAFPVIVAVLSRRRRYLLPALAPVLFASLGLSLLLAAERPAHAFYLVHYRLWELLAGVLAYLLQDRALALAGGSGGTMAMIGLALVVAGVLVTPLGGGWPGYATLVPAIGACLIVIYGDQPSAANRVLACAPMRGIGLISYSAYLIHYPVFLFPEVAGHPIGTPWHKAAAVAAILALAALNWRLVEQPFRRKGPLPSRMVRGLAGVAAFLAAFAVAGHVTRGFPWRLPPAAREVIQYGRSRSPTHDACTLGRTEAQKVDPEAACTDHRDAPGPEIVLWGDSHMSTLAYQIVQGLPDVPIRQLTLGGCPPIPVVVNIDQLTRRPVRMTDGCARFNETLLDYILSHDHIGGVVLFAYWSNYTERETFDAGDGNRLADSVYSIPVGGDPEMPEEARQVYMKVRFAEMVGRLVAAGKQVLIVYPLPIAGASLPDRVARQIWRTGEVPALLSYPAEVFRRHSARARALLDAAPSGPSVSRIDVSDVFCSETEGCVIFEDGVPFMFDTSHLSQPGVARVVPRLLPAIRELHDRAGAISP